jgi:DNA repair photolyase
MARFGGYPSMEDISRIIRVKTNAPQVLEKEVGRLKRKELVWIGSVCDPYQQAESQYNITRNCLAVLSGHGFPYSIVTKSHLVTRDLDIIQRDRDRNEVIFTITTEDPIVKQAIEPNSPSTMERLQAIQTLARAGVNVKVFLLPIIPFMTDGSNIESLVAKIAQSGARNVYAGLLRLSPVTWSFFSRRLDPQIREKMEELYQRRGESFGGATVPPTEYRHNVLQRASNACRRAGIGFFCEDKFFDLNHETSMPVDQWKYVTPYDVWKFMKTRGLSVLTPEQLQEFAHQRATNPQFEAVLRSLGQIHINDLQKLT